MRPTFNGVVLTIPPYFGFGRDYFLDHDLVIDKDGRIYVVVGNKHPPDALIAYLKYVPTTSKTLWKGVFTYYERVLREYSAADLQRVMFAYGGYRYDSTLNTLVPYVKKDHIGLWLKPEEKLMELRRRVKDLIEETAVEAAEFVASRSGVNPRKLGIGGSILAGIHGPHSDIDLIVYGCKEAIDVVETRDLGLSEVSESVYKEKIVKELKLAGLNPGLYEVFKPFRKYYMFRGFNVTISFVNEFSGRYGDEVLTPLKPVEAVIEVVENDCRALFYPSYASVVKVKTSSLGDVGIDGIVCYNGFFNSLLYRGGVLKVKGLLEVSKPSGKHYVVVGVKEGQSYILPQHL
ncbi:MAG: hypothetical protein B7O98_03950 [Zestosphaera tikiterensis]|uniref:Polymerase nucleotidyl transferase domain-containing protein n=1 Tax=Zestosphaera tikiterensis TaxID=1973259 RepID=A0A2R7Y7R4_9CREN|nr:MAG: hypothetical protein B7O98_03950 [Zestosphaera tikiterensis]